MIQYWNLDCVLRHELQRGREGQSPLQGAKVSCCLSPTILLWPYLTADERVLHATLHPLGCYSACPQSSAECGEAESRMGSAKNIVGANTGAEVLAMLTLLQSWTDWRRLQLVDLFAFQHVPAKATKAWAALVPRPHLELQMQYLRERPCLIESKLLRCRSKKTSLAVFNACHAATLVSFGFSTVSVLVISAAPPFSCVPGSLPSPEQSSPSCL